MKSGAFVIFAVSDAVSLFTSSTSLLMFLSILTSRYAEEDFLHALPKRLRVRFFTLFLSILFMMVVDGNTNDSDSFDDMTISDQDNEDAVEPTDHLTADSHPDSIETAALSHLEKNDDDDVEAFDDLPIDSIDTAALDEDPHTDVLPANSDSIDTAVPYFQSPFWGSDTALSPILRSPRRIHLLDSRHDGNTSFPKKLRRCHYSIYS